MNSFYSHMIDSITEINNQKLFYDITLVTDDNRKIKSHKLILSAVSDYFRSMLSEKFIEGSLNEVRVYDISYTTLKELISFCYSGKLDIHEYNVKDLIIKADYLSMKHAVTLCEDFIIKKLDCDNCLQVYMFSKEHNLFRLMDVALSTIIMNITTIYKHDNFGLLDEKDIELILGSDYLNIIDEDISVVILFNWLRYNNVTRCPLSILAKIRLSLLSNQVSKFIHDTKEFNYDDKYKQLISSADKPRKMVQGYIISIGGKHSFHDNYISIDIYVPLVDDWVTLNNISHRMQFFSVAIIDTIIYIVGGMIGYMPISNVYCYDIKSNTWSETTSLRSPRYGCGLVSHNGKLYVIGGKGYYDYLNTVEYWRPGYSKWRKLPHLREPKTNVGVTVVNDTIYAVGGIRESVFINRSECIDTVESLSHNGWISHSPLPESRAYVAITSYNKFIYIAGGCIIENNKLSITTDKVNMYDTENDIWSSLSPLKSARSNASLCVLGNDLYIIGGFMEDMCINSVERFNPETNDWDTTISGPNSPKIGQCSVVMKNNCPWKMLTYSKSFIKKIERYLNKNDFLYLS
uniref:Kelch-like protein n=1 Tax=Swinepox virus TaxID=10276 RepID=A0A0N9DU44_SWPV|nr:kelch-like protein [Swinepox virus]